MNTDTPLSKVLIPIVIGVLAFAGGWFLHMKNPGLLGNLGSTAEIREGVYDLLGSNPGSTKVDYEGTVTISRTGMIYDLVWNIRGQTQRGVGILDRGVLSVGYIDITDGNMKDAGAVSYIADSKERLRGTWTSVKGGTIGTETLQWQSEIPSAAPSGATINTNAECESAYGQNVDAIAAEYAKKSGTFSKALFYSPTLKICVGVVEIAQDNIKDIETFNAATGKALDVNDNAVAFQDWSTVPASVPTTK